MGKLHKLRRAIKRDPDRWHSYSKARGAYQAPCGWRPSYWFDKPYRAFVRHVLRSLGYDVF